MSKISKLTEQARKEGWRFEYNEKAQFVWAIKENCASRVAVYIASTFCNAHDVDVDQLGHAIAAAMNGKEG